MKTFVLDSSSITWLAPVSYGTTSDRCVSVKSADGRVWLYAETVYYKPSGSGGKGVKGKYLLKWEVQVDGKSVPVIAGKNWTYDFETAVKVAEKSV